MCLCNGAFECVWRPAWRPPPPAGVRANGASADDCAPAATARSRQRLRYGMYANVCMDACARVRVGADIHSGRKQDVTTHVSAAISAVAPSQREAPRQDFPCQLPCRSLPSPAAPSLPRSCFCPGAAPATPQPLPPPCRPHPPRTTQGFVSCAEPPASSALPSLPHPPFFPAFSLFFSPLRLQSLARPPSPFLPIPPAPLAPLPTPSLPPRRR